jgi:hypothetical protein
MLTADPTYQTPIACRDAIASDVIRTPLTGVQIPEHPAIGQGPSDKSPRCKARSRSANQRYCALCRTAEVPVG